MSQNTSVVTIPDASIPDSVLSGEKTLGEYIDEKIAAGGMADEDVAERDRLADALITRGSEYTEKDRQALTQTPVSILEKLAENAPGVSGEALTANADAYGTGVGPSGEPPTPTVSGDDDDPDAYDTGVGGER